jgi:hypothetical protein
LHAHIAIRPKHRNSLCKVSIAGQSPRIRKRCIGCEKLCELTNAARKYEFGLDWLSSSFVFDFDVEPRNQKRSLAGSISKIVELERCARREDLSIGPVTYTRSSYVLGDLANDAKLRLIFKGSEWIVGSNRLRIVKDSWFSAVERHRVRLTVTVNFDVETLRKCVYDRGAHTMQTAGCGIGAGAKLATSVQLGKDNLDTGETGFRLDINGDTSSSVTNLNRAVGVESNINHVSVTCEGLVNGVINDLPQAVHEATRVGCSDVHTGTLTNGFEPFQNGKMAS